MTLQECYAAMGGNYEEVLGRLRSDRLIQKFVLKFVDDGSYQLLLDSMASQNYEDAFRAAHTIKGVCQNLGLTRLLNSSSQLSRLYSGGRRPCGAGGHGLPGNHRRHSGFPGVPWCVMPGAAARGHGGTNR